MVISTLLFTIMNTLVKYLIDFGTFQLVFFRSLGSLVFTFSFLIQQKIPMWGNQKRLLVFRGFAGVTSMILFFFSLHYMSVGAAVTLRYTSPIFVALLAVFLLKEKIKLLQWIFFILAFIGVLMVKGFDPIVDFYGFTIILICAFFSAIVYLLISKIGKGDHPVVIVHYFMLIATLVGAIGCFYDWKTPVGIEWALLLSLGVVGFLAQIFMTKALQIGPAFQIAPFKYVEVVFSLLFGLLFFQELYNFYSLVGVFLIILGLALNLIYKSKEKQTSKK